MPFWGLKKHKEFNLSERLHPEKGKTRRIKFERLPRRKVRSLWWTIAVFLIVLYLFFYLKRIM